ncbi:MAG: hypothetical protein IJH95_05580 [Mogibacterium sp.]|nr:hypothetical protein [Mogibacterium sp.]
MSPFPVGRPKKLGNMQIAGSTVLTIELMEPEAGKGLTAKGYSGTE